MEKGNKRFKTEYSLDTDRICEKVMARIRKRELTILRVSLFAYGTLLTATLVAVVPTLQYLSRELIASDAGQYISLLFTESNSILSYWDSFILSTLNSLPINGILLTIAILLLCTNCFKQFVFYFSSYSRKSQSYSLLPIQINHGQIK